MVNPIKKIIFCVGLILIFIPIFASAEYTLEMPLPGVTDAAMADPGAYVRGLFIFGLAALGFLAVGAIALGGIQYMIAGSIGSAQKSKDLIVGALMGVGLLLGSYLLLTTIDPGLVKLSPKITPIGDLAAPATPKPVAAPPAKATKETFLFMAAEFGSGQGGQAECQTFGQNFLNQKNGAVKNTGFAYTLIEANWDLGNICNITLQKQAIAK